MSEGRQAGPADDLWREYRRAPYAILFYTLLFTLLATPIAMSVGFSGTLFRLLIGLSLIAAVMPNATRRTRRLMLAAVLLLAAGQFAPDRGLLAVAAQAARILIPLIGLLSAAGALRFAMMSAAVSRETIYAALGTYLLAGLFFGQIYWWLESVDSGSVVGPDPLSELNAVYFSFVTLATLGYGDFLPRTAIARGIVMFEFVSGQLYLAALVARLVGAFEARTP